MAIEWVYLSTRWSLSRVQAVLNVVISVLGTIGIWSFSRYWWQRGSAGVVREGSIVPLSKLLTVSTPGEGWDAFTVLRSRAFARENWRLLFQLVIIIGATLACTFNGFIAQASLRSTRVIQKCQLEVLKVIKGGGAGGNEIVANVLWNDTIQSLDLAGFPNDQLLDYLPPLNLPWTYIPHEWDPTWSMSCNYIPETVLQNVVAPGNYTFYDPVNAFPAFRETYDPAWLDTSKYRIQADFTSWTIMDGESNPPFTDVLFFILIQPDPRKFDRMDHNNDTLQLSISALHAQHFYASNSSIEDSTENGATKWQPTGPVRNASYTRAECNITRKSLVPDEEAIPWVWTNDTYSITMAYQNYWTHQLEEQSSKQVPVDIPAAQTMLRFYQAYMISVNTNQAFPSLQYVSMWKDAVQISIVFLTFFIILAFLALCQAGRYCYFVRRNKLKLEQINIPDSKMGWMIHAAKISNLEEEKETSVIIARKDRDYFRTANFGCGDTSSPESDIGLRRPSLARIYCDRISIAGASPGAIKNSLSKDAKQSTRNQITIHQEKEVGNNDKDVPLDKAQVVAPEEPHSGQGVNFSPADEKA